MKNNKGIEGAVRLFRAQVGIVLIMSIVLGVLSSLHAAISMLLGGLVSAIPNAYFAKVLFRHHGAQEAKKIVNSFYKAEAIKLLLTFSLFAIIFKFFKVVPLLFFAGFIAAQMMFWFAPIIIDYKQKRSDRDRNGI